MIKRCGIGSVMGGVRSEEGVVYVVRGRGHYSSIREYVVLGRVCDDIEARLIVRKLMYNY